MNPTTGRLYRGFNAVRLMRRETRDPRWCTAEQAKAAGWIVHPDAVGVLIPERSAAGLVATRVFNAGEIHGIPTLGPYIPDWNVVELGAEVVARHGVKVIEDQASHLFYNVAWDEIHAPPAPAEGDRRSYFSRLIHETLHATGHPSRGNRDFGRSFASEEYAAEEMRTQIATLLVCSRLNLPFSPEDHEEYAARWIALLERDPGAVLRLSAEAEVMAEQFLRAGRQVIQEREQQRVMRELEMGPPAAFAVYRDIWAEIPAAIRTQVWAEDRGDRASAPPPPLAAFADVWRQVPAFNRIQAWIEYRPDATQPSIAFELSGIDVRDFVEQYRRNDERKASAARIYVFVPFEEREEAKKAGARSDGEKRCWYVPAHWDLKRFEKWMKPPRAMSLPEMQSEFRKACEAVGLVMDADPSNDGKWYRVPVTGGKHKNKKSGAYMLRADGHGYIHNKFTGEQATWAPDRPLAVSEAEMTRMRENAATREREVQAGHERLSSESMKRWAAIKPVNTHPYCERKQVPAIGLRQWGRDLVIPMHDETGKIWNLQRISPKPGGAKLYQTDARKSGTFYVPDGLEALDRASVILFGEGYATAMTVEQGASAPCVVCFDSGNIGHVIKALGKRIEGKDLIIACDNDVVSVERAARMLNGDEDAGARVKLGYPRVRASDIQRAIDEGARVPIGEEGGWMLAARESREPAHFECLRLYIEVWQGETRRHKQMVNNAGVEKGLEAAAEHGAKAVAPRFKDPDAYEKGCSDFNDLHHHEGLAAVQYQLASVIDLVRGRADAELRAREIKPNLIEVLAPEPDGRYAGAVIAHAACHAVQDTGRNTAVAHPFDKLDRIPAPGSVAKIHYKEGRGSVAPENAHHVGKER